MGRQRVRTGGKTYVLYIDVRLFDILKRIAKSRSVSINTLVTSELAKKYSEESDL